MSYPLDVPTQKFIGKDFTVARYCGITSAVKAGAYCVAIGDTELIQYGAQTAIVDFLKVKVLSDGDNAILLDDEHKLLLNNK